MQNQITFKRVNPDNNTEIEITLVKTEQARERRDGAGKKSFYFHPESEQTLDNYLETYGNKFVTDLATEGMNRLYQSAWLNQAEGDESRFLEIVTNPEFSGRVKDSAYYMRLAATLSKKKDLKGAQEAMLKATSLLASEMERAEEKEETTYEN